MPSSPVPNYPRQVMNPGDAGDLKISAYQGSADQFRVSATPIGNTYTPITTSAQTVVKGNPGFLHGITFNSQNISSVALYDNTVSGGTTIATFGPSAQTGGPFYQFDLAFLTGLVVSSGSSNTNITLMWQ